jgi:hypothetical protein
VHLFAYRTFANVTLKAEPTPGAPTLAADVP